MSRREPMNDPPEVIVFLTLMVALFALLSCMMTVGERNYDQCIDGMYEGSGDTVDTCEGFLLFGSP